jgi:hypothetical protein
MDADGRLRDSCLLWKGERQDPNRSEPRLCLDHRDGRGFASFAAEK